MKAPLICIIIAVIAVITTTTATIANVQYELDQLLSQQPLPLQQQPLPLQPHRVGNDTLPMLIKAHRYNSKIANLTSPIGFSIVNIPVNVTRNNIEVEFQGAKVDSCDMISRTFDQYGVEIGYDFAAKISTPSYSRFAASPRFFQPSVQEYSYEVNLFCYATSDGFLSNFIKATATIGSSMTPVTYLEEYQPLGTLDVSFEEISVQPPPTDGAQFFSFRIAVTSLNTSIAAGTTLHFGEMFQNMQLVQIGASSKPKCSYVHHHGISTFYDVVPILSPFGQLHNGHAFSMVVPVTISSGDDFSFSCSTDYAFVSKLHPNYKSQLWSVTTDYPLTRIQAQNYVVQRF